MQRGNIPILIILIVAAFAVFAIHSKYLETRQLINLYQPVTNVLNKKPLPASNSGETATWKTYTDSDGFFTLEYPDNWRINYLYSGPLNHDIWNKKQDITFSGPEGKVFLWWVDTYGGGCGYGWGKILINDKSYAVCHFVNPTTGIESWTNMTNKFNSKSNLGVNIEAYANKPIQKNRDTVLKALQSVHFSSSSFK